jgi:integrase
MRVAAVAYFHRKAGLESPASASVVREVICGAKRLSKPAIGKAAFSADQVRAMVSSLPGTPQGKRNRAILCLGFATALRRSNLSALTLSDIEFRPEGVAIRVLREKQNQVGEPRWIGVFRTRRRSCPVRALRAWLEIRGNEPGPLFCHVRRSRVYPRAGLSSQEFGPIVQRAAAAAGLDPERYGAHSLRAGFVTAAAENGTSPLVIMQTTGHRSMSTLERYFRPASAFNVNPLARLL